MHRFKYLLIAVAALAVSHPAQAQDAGKRRSVLVTGANSGIGLAITQYLTARGFHVYGTARKDEDLKTLNAMPNVTAVKLDVTKQADVDAAAKFVAEQGRGLYAVVNNAGVAAVGELTAVSDQDVLWQHDVNVMGPLRVNRAFVPMLKQSKGRTAIIGSLSGFITGPSGGAYSMTKFATEAYTDTLAMELKDSGVAVGIIDEDDDRQIRAEPAAHRRAEEGAGRRAGGGGQAQGADRGRRAGLSFPEQRHAAPALHGGADQRDGGSGDARHAGAHGTAQRQPAGLCAQPGRAGEDAG
jgi:NAD(P)-dependent dehydrogenase (short-subunit alcohol dehydrogenase family)